MQNRQAGTAYIGGYCRITVVAMATSCASGMSRFGGHGFLMQEKSLHWMFTPLLYISISVFTLNALKKNVPTTPVISVVLLVNYSINSYRKEESY